MKLMPPTYFFILLGLSILFHFIFPIIKFIYPPYTYFGYLFIILGGIFGLWADILMKIKHTTVKPNEKPCFLITSGPYAVSRNPHYLGFALMLFGIVILHGTLFPFIFPIIFIILMEKLFIPIEDKNLEKVFGKKYLNYKKRVRRWI